MDNAFIIDILGPWSKFDALPVLFDPGEVDLAVFPLPELAVGVVPPIEVRLDPGGLDKED
jgi:hypothetical protein